MGNSKIPGVKGEAGFESSELLNSFFLLCTNNSGLSLYYPSSFYPTILSSLANAMAPVSF